MQVRLGTLAQEKHVKYLEQQERNEVLRRQMQYSSKRLAQLTQKIAEEESVLQRFQQNYERENSLSRHLDQQNQVMSRDAQQRELQKQRIEQQVKQFKQAHEQLIYENQKCLLTIRVSDIQLQKQEKHLSGHNQQYQKEQMRKLAIEKQLASAKTELAQLQKEIRKVQDRIEKLV